MGKYFGKVGYVIPTKTAPGVYESVEPIERFYYGDYLEDYQRWSDDQKVNDDLRIRTKISIIADPFATANFSKIKYCEHMGICWKVTEIQPAYPRLVLTLGGEYNGEQAKSAC